MCWQLRFTLPLRHRLRYHVCSLLERERTLLILDMATVSFESISGHPYYPWNLVVSGRYYAPHTYPASILILAFSAGCTALLTSAWLLTRRSNSRLKTLDQALSLWFILSRWLNMRCESPLNKTCSWLNPLLF